MILALARTRDEKRVEMIIDVEVIVPDHQVRPGLHVVPCVDRLDVHPSNVARSRCPGLRGVGPDTGQHPALHPHLAGAGQEVGERDLHHAVRVEDGVLRRVETETDRLVKVGEAVVPGRKHDVGAGIVRLAVTVVAAVPIRTKTKPRARHSAWNIKQREDADLVSGGILHRNHGGSGTRVNMMSSMASSMSY